MAPGAGLAEGVFSTLLRAAFVTKITNWSEQDIKRGILSLASFTSKSACDRFPPVLEAVGRWLVLTQAGLNWHRVS